MLTVALKLFKIWIKVVDKQKINAYNKNKYVDQDMIYKFIFKRVSGWCKLINDL